MSHPETTAAYPPPPAPPVPPAAAGADTRSKTLSWAALGTGVLGLVLVGISFIPMIWVSLVLALVGGILLLAGLVLGIVALANKRVGGKGIGIAAIVVSVLGSGLGVAALVWAVLVIGLGAVGESSSTETGQSSSVASEGESAYLAAVRPELVALFQEADESLTEQDVADAFPDAILISMGDSILLAGDTGRDAMVQALTQSTGGAFSADQAIRFYDVIQSAAQEHLAD